MAIECPICIRCSKHLTRISSVSLHSLTFGMNYPSSENTTEAQRFEEYPEITKRVDGGNTVPTGVVSEACMLTLCDLLPHSLCW